jgi:predicted ester cyclase
MSLEDNKALVRRFYLEIDKGNLAAMDELVGENYLNHDPAPFPGSPSGRAGLKHAFEQFWRATPGHHVIEDQIAEGNLVVTRLRGVGKHEGEIFGIPPTGNDLDVKAIAIHRIENGQLVENWSTTDTAAQLQQLGVIKLPAPPSKSDA